MTYSWQFDSTVSALGRCTGLLDMKVSKFSSGRLDNTDLVRLGVVSAWGQYRRSNSDTPSVGGRFIEVQRFVWEAGYAHGLRRLYVNLLEDILAVVCFVDC